MLYDDNTAGQTYELYGPKEYSTAEIAQLVDREIYKKRTHINLPKVILKPLATVLNRVLWWPVLSAEDVDREFLDQKIDETAKTFADLGITPTDLKDHYLVSRSAPFPLIHRGRVMSTVLTILRSTGTAAILTTISLPRRRRRRRRKASIYTCWISNRCI